VGNVNAFREGNAHRKRSRTDHLFRVAGHAFGTSTISDQIFWNFSEPIACGNPQLQPQILASFGARFAQSGVKAATLLEYVLTHQDGAAVSDHVGVEVPVEDPAVH